MAKKPMDELLRLIEPSFNEDISISDIEINEINIHKIVNFVIDRVVELTGDESLREQLQNRAKELEFVFFKDTTELNQSVNTNENIKGAYINKQDKLLLSRKINNKKDIGTIVHEICHALSDSTKKGGESGLQIGENKRCEELEDIKSENTKRGERIGSLLNEAMTVVLTDKILEDSVGERSKDRVLPLMLFAGFCGKTFPGMISLYFCETNWLNDDLKKRFSAKSPDNAEKFIHLFSQNVKNNPQMEEIINDAINNSVGYQQNENRMDTMLDALKLIYNADLSSGEYYNWIMEEIIDEKKKPKELIKYLEEKNNNINDESSWEDI